MVPVRPRNSPPLADSWAADGAQLSARRVPTLKENWDWSAAAPETAAGAEAPGATGSAGTAETETDVAEAGLAGTDPVCQQTPPILQWAASDVG